MKKLLFYLLCLSIPFSLYNCNKNKKSESETTDIQPETEIIEVSSSSYAPVPFPKVNIPGFNFPEKEKIIDSWIAENDLNKIYNHGWGIWIGLTQKTNEVYKKDTLRVYETWNTPEEIKIKLGSQNKLKSTPRIRATMETPTQFHKFQVLPDTKTVETVYYDPSAAKYAIDNKIFLKSVLNTMQKKGDSVRFPDKAITIKPTYKIISKDTAIANNGIYQMEAWRGVNTPDTIPFPEKKWNACVYVDINNNATGNPSIDRGCKGSLKDHTYNLNDFIHFAIDKEMAEYVNKQKDGYNAKAGDYAILVGMHVATRETTRWTWQTFWWSADPDNPNFPSDGSVASARPDKLTGPARHYAMSVAYSMVYPAQPYSGGTSTGKPIYAFNPFLEAPFDSKTLNNGGSDNYATVNDNGTIIENKVGTRTNCMSCHAHANYYNATIGGKPAKKFGYLGDTYVDMKAPYFDGVVKLDFAYSIGASIIDDTKSSSNDKEEYQ
ncbi:hypothetical protein [Aquimarina sp. 2201CG5-10]|uniref:hypothetical protein n=1 Tax=Aquimarina callyspongiae TaxID=3098150 RepID=UPI002AB44CBA|nr:hypothetical protein [Aquimarina sp. 2201CG5-10]MDY8134068.1 hypothetical protein [Aquimarina sp. 2201CG5-10]